MRKPKTPLLSFLQKCFQSAVTSENKGFDYVEELREKHSIERYNRRLFLTKSLGTVTVGGMILSLAKDVNAQTLPKIAIVGAGIAGLNAAYQLKKLNFPMSNIRLYEASSENSWGRIRTKYMSNGITAELGGEFIDSNHADMLRLAKEFNLSLIDTVADGKGLIKDSYFFGGKHHTEKQVVSEFRSIAKKIEKDNKIYESENEIKIKKFDDTSIEQYLKENLGLRGWFYDLLNTAYTSEFGLETGEQSALNFITMIGTDLTKGFNIFGDSDERYKINGGNGTLTAKLKEILEPQIEKGKKLEHIKQSGNKYTLSFIGEKDVDADVIILAMPFTKLREVTFSDGLFTPNKIKAINQLGYGSSSKLLIETKSRIWRENKRAGYLFNEDVQNGWDFSQGQKENKGSGGYTVFLGGNAGRSLNEDSVNKYINVLNNAFTGFKDSYKDKLVINWAKDDLIGGGYASYKVGQWTSISGEEIKPQGNIFFCGEHCSEDFQGYMNGGAETGRKIAEEVIKKFNPKVVKNKKTR
jgi:monoamine oxidase